MRIRGAVPGISQPFSVILKTADETVNNSTRQPDNELTAALLAGRRYRFRLVALWTAGGIEGLVLGFAYTGVLVAGHWMNVLAAQEAVAPQARSSLSVLGPESLNTTGAADCQLTIEGYLETSTAGALTFEWGQNAPAAVNTILRAGSRLELQLLN